jgi:hypothetical protein
MPDLYIGVFIRITGLARQADRVLCVAPADTDTGSKVSRFTVLLLHCLTSVRAMPWRWNCARSQFVGREAWVGLTYRQPATVV